MSIFFPIKSDHLRIPAHSLVRRQHERKTCRQQNICVKHTLQDKLSQPRSFEAKQGGGCGVIRRPLELKWEKLLKSGVYLFFCSFAIWPGASYFMSFSFLIYKMGMIVPASPSWTQQLPDKITFPWKSTFQWPLLVWYGLKTIKNSIYWVNTMAQHYFKWYSALQQTLWRSYFLKY